MELTAEIYYANIVISRAALRTGTNEAMQRNGFCFLKISGLTYPLTIGPPKGTSLSHGELYTILTNKAAKGGKGSIVAIVAGTKAETVIEVIRKIPEALRKKVSEITLDMAGSMSMIAKRCFPRATRVTDRSLRRSDSRTKASYRSFARDPHQIPLGSTGSRK